MTYGNPGPGLDQAQKRFNIHTVLVDPGLIFILYW